MSNGALRDLRSLLADQHGILMDLIYTVRPPLGDEGWLDLVVAWEDEEALIGELSSVVDGLSTHQGDERKTRMIRALADRVAALEEVIQALKEASKASCACHVQELTAEPVPAGVSRVGPDWASTDLKREEEYVKEYYDREYQRRYPHYAPELAVALWAQLCKKRDADTAWLTQNSPGQGDVKTAPAPRRSKQKKTKAQIMAMTAAEQWAYADESLVRIAYNKMGVKELAESWGLHPNTLTKWRQAARAFSPRERPANVKPDKLMAQAKEEDK